MYPPTTRENISKSERGRFQQRDVREWGSLTQRLAARTEIVNVYVCKITCVVVVSEFYVTCKYSYQPSYITYMVRITSVPHIIELPTLHTHTYT